MFAKLIGARTIIVNAVLLITAILRGRHPDKVPDEATVLAIINGFLDALTSAPGFGVINILLRLITSTPVLSGVRSG